MLYSDVLYIEQSNICPSFMKIYISILNNIPLFLIRWFRCMVSYCLTKLFMHRWIKRILSSALFVWAGLFMNFFNLILRKETQFAFKIRKPVLPQENTFVRSRSSAFRKAEGKQGKQLLLVSSHATINGPSSNWCLATDETSELAYSLANFSFRQPAEWT